MQEKEIAKIIVTRPKGSWRWQNAYALSTYARTPGGKWHFIERTGKFAYTNITAHLWAKYPAGLKGLPK